MKLLNRSAVVITPTCVFLEWIRSLNLSNEECQSYLQTPIGDHEASTYLIDEVESQEHYFAQLAKAAPMILQNEFSAWDEFGDQWPSDLLNQSLDKWFDHKLAVVAFDTSARALMVADLEKLESE
ncbi:MAG: hypothetical protein ACPGPF_07810 [Pontibacterium sp.]